MIFAKVDTELRDHRRAHEAGSAMATWTWALLWTRAKEEDGYVSRSALRGAWTGERQALADMRKLVKVGLVEEVPADFTGTSPGLRADFAGGWRILRYDLHNETREAISKRREQETKRKASFRSKDSRVSRWDTRVPPGAGTPVGVPRTETESESESETESEEIPEGEHAAPPAPPPKVKAAARGTRIPEGFTPSDGTLAALRLEGIADPAASLPSFRDYWTAKAGAAATKLDWDATFRVWVRKDGARAPSGGPQRPAPGGRLIQVPLPEQADRFDFSEEANDRRRVERERRNAGM